MTQFLNSLQSWSFFGPAFFSVALLNVKGFELATGNSFYPFSKLSADRHHFIPAPVWIENIDSMSVDDVARPIMDVLWQAFGQERCPDFDKATGKFNPRQ
jgi:hypothetical protein